MWEAALANKNTNKRRTRWFTAISIVYGVAVLIGAWWLGFLDPKSERIGPSEWGDVLAGIFSPLAFLWLLYASLSQRDELELQREELRQNNETQREQQRAMEQQALALDAQVKRLEAEATARYDPLVVLMRLEKDGSRVFGMTLKNLGETVLNVMLLDGASPHAIGVGAHNRKVKGTISHWQRDEPLYMHIPDTPDRGQFQFRIHMQRIDATGVTYTYIVLMKERRIHLLARENVEVVSAHPDLTDPIEETPGQH